MQRRGFLKRLGGLPLVAAVVPGLVPPDPAPLAGMPRYITRQETRPTRRFLTDAELVALRNRVLASPFLMDEIEAAALRYYGPL